MRKVCVVHFPGVLADSTDPRGAIAALGGQENLRESVNSALDGNDANLSLSLRPGNLSSRSNIGSTISSDSQNLFVLRIFRQPEASVGSASCHQVALRGEITACIRAQISFPGIADFQYFSRDSLDAMDTWRAMARSPLASSISEQILEQPPAGVVTRNCDLNSPSIAEEIDWREKTATEQVCDMSMKIADMIRAGGNNDDHAIVSQVRPIRFARSAVETGASGVWFKMLAKGTPVRSEVLPDDNHGMPPAVSDSAPKERGEIGTNSPENCMQLLFPCDRRLDSDRLRNLSYRISIVTKDIPMSPATQECLGSRRTAVVGFLQSKFLERPVWSRRALLSKCSETVRKAFKAAITRIAYSFCDMSGPFHALWVRYGYDPRQKVSDVIYQSIIVRIADPLSLEAMRRRVHNMSESSGILSDDLDQVGNYTISELPTKQQVSLQLCDIDVPALKDILLCPEYTRSRFDRFTGFLSKEGHAEIVRLCRERVREHALQFIGEDSAREFLKGHVERRQRMLFRRMSTTHAKKHNVFSRESNVRDLSATGTARPNSSDTDLHHGSDTENHRHTLMERSQGDILQQHKHNEGTSHDSGRESTPEDRNMLSTTLEERLLNSDSICNASSTHVARRSLESEGDIQFEAMVESYVSTTELDSIPKLDASPIEELSGNDNDDESLLGFEVYSADSDSLSDNGSDEKSETMDVDGD